MTCDKCQKIKNNLIFAREKRDKAPISWLCDGCVNGNYRTTLKIRAAKGYTVDNSNNWGYIIGM